MVQINGHADLYRLVVHQSFLELLVPPVNRCNYPGVDRGGAIMCEDMRHAGEDSL